MANEGTKLGKPDVESVVQGQYTLVRFVRDLASVAAPVTATNIEDIQDINVGAMAYNNEVEVFHFGGGDDKLDLRSDHEYDGSMSVLTGGAADIMAALLGETFASGSMAGMPLVFPNYPIVHMEAILRKLDNTTQIHSLVLQDLIFNPVNYPIAEGVNNTEFTFKSRFDATPIANGTYMVFDKWDGDGSTTEFTPSQEPLQITDATMDGRDTWDFDYAFFIKVKLSTDTYGTRQYTGVTITPATPVITFTTAPASGSEISMLYVAAIS